MGELPLSAGQLLSSAAETRENETTLEGNVGTGSAACEATLPVTSRRCKELLDEVAHKEAALSQLRSVLEEMSADYERVQRHNERIQMELDVLTSRFNVQQEELIATKSKVVMQESKLQHADEDYARCTQKLQWDLETTTEERNQIVEERKSLWSQIRSLRDDVEEQQRAREADAVLWEGRLEQARKEAVTKARAALREREEILSLREAELQRSVSRLEGRFDGDAAEARRLEALNESLKLRVEEMRECVQREAEMRQRLEAARGAQQAELRLLNERMEFERRERLEQQKVIEESYEAQLREVRRVGELAEQERRRQEDENRRILRELKLDAQRARDEWLAQQKHLELTIGNLRGEVDRERLRFDEVDGLRQRAEAALLRTQRELKSSQQREATLQETVDGAQSTLMKHRATELRLSGEIERLLAVVAEKEREIERWKSTVERLEWQRHMCGDDVHSLLPHSFHHRLQQHQQLSEPESRRDVADARSDSVMLPSTSPSAVPISTWGSLPASSRATGPRKASPRAVSIPSQCPSCFLTPCVDGQQRCQQPRSSQRIESIDRTPTCLASDASRLDCARSAEEEQAELLRSILQDVLWEYLQPDDGSVPGPRSDGGWLCMNSLQTRATSQDASHTPLQQREENPGARPPLSRTARGHGPPQAYSEVCVETTPSLLRRLLVETPNAYATPPHSSTPREHMVQLDGSDRDNGTERRRCSILGTSAVIAESAAAASRAAVSSKEVVAPSLVEAPTSDLTVSGTRAFVDSSTSNFPVELSLMACEQQASLPTKFGGERGAENSKGTRKDFELQSSRGADWRQSNHTPAFSICCKSRGSGCMEPPGSAKWRDEGSDYLGVRDGGTRGVENCGRGGHNGLGLVGGNVGQFPSSASDAKGTSSVSSIGSDVTSSACASTAPPGPPLHLTALQERFAAMFVL